MFGCTSCPTSVCPACKTKWDEEWGEEVFQDGCPFCLGLCCCSDKSVDCERCVTVTWQCLDSAHLFCEHFPFLN